MYNDWSLPLDLVLHSMTTPHICPTCGQDIVVPNDITRMTVTPNLRLILAKLYRRKNDIVPYDNFEISYRSLQVQICRLREAIHDSGLPYVIVTEFGIGYMLKELPHARD